MQKVQVKKLIEVTATFLVGGEEEADASTTVFCDETSELAGSIVAVVCQDGKILEKSKNGPLVEIESHTSPHPVEIIHL
ncbi:MAG TPA: hypothetical protein VKX46_08740 [Ktedonobacteraceae bacterium]|nr:hypothetical protein [Ktedonobacteraceae bacterium]